MRILIVVPRYHTNLISYIKLFKKYNYAIDMHVKYITKNECHFFVKPRILDKNILSFFFKWRNNFYLPRLFNYFNLLNKKKYNLVIFRYTDHFSSCIFLLFFKIIKLKVIIYEQIQYSKNLNNNLIFLLKNFFKKKFSIATVSPIFSNYNLKNSYNYFLPFTPEIKKKKIFQNIPNFLFVARYESRKKHFEFLEIINDLAKNYKFIVNFVGHIFNDDNKNYFNELSNKVMDYNLIKFVKLYKNINYLNMKNFYKNNDLLILPSIREDASVSVIEAIGYGLGVITTKSNGTSCFVKNNFNGYIVDDGNFYQIKTQLIKILSNNFLIRKFSINSNSLAQKYLSEKVFKENWNNLILNS